MDTFIIVLITTMGFKILMKFNNYKVLFEIERVNNNDRAFELVHINFYNTISLIVLFLRLVNRKGK